MYSDASKTSKMEPFAKLISGILQLDPSSRYECEGKQVVYEIQTIRPKWTTAKIKLLNCFS